MAAAQSYCSASRGQHALEPLPQGGCAALLLWLLEMSLATGCCQPERICRQELRFLTHISTEFRQLSCHGELE